ncbi:hypothetical protein QCA50_011481 [Cerrena zonata]|uniref:Uncharacterized protein n=1 Tax=Cerrena zonata TaxID=2478898 RepID=A0AAW0G5P2_9APHY
MIPRLPWVSTSSDVLASPLRVLVGSCRGFRASKNHECSSENWYQCMERVALQPPLSVRAFWREKLLLS